MCVLYVLGRDSDILIPCFSVVPLSLLFLFLFWFESLLFIKKENVDFKQCVHKLKALSYVQTFEGTLMNLLFPASHLRFVHQHITIKNACKAGRERAPSMRECLIFRVSACLSGLISYWARYVWPVLTWGPLMGSSTLLPPQ